MKHFLKAYGHFAERDFLLMAGPSTAGLRWKHVSYTWVEMEDGRWKKKTITFSTLNHSRKNLRLFDP